MCGKKVLEQFILNIPDLSLISDDVSPDSLEDILDALEDTAEESPQEDSPLESDGSASNRVI